MAMLRNGLIYFDQAIRDGSIRKAADNLHVASSAINRQLLNLEAELGVELFVRLPRGIRPTAAGEALLSCIRRWDREAQQLTQEIGRLRGGVRGTIRIAAAESLTEDVLPRAMARLQTKFPLVDYTLISGNNYRIRAELLAKEADLVCAFDLTDTGPTSTLFSLQTPIGVIMPPGHPLAEREQIALSHCVGHPVVAPDSEWLGHSVLRELLESRQTPLRIVARVERIGLLHSLVEAGMGIAFLSRVGLDRQIAAGRIVWRPFVPGTIRAASVSLVVARGRALPNFVSELADLVKEELAAQVG